jgi:hypothetical protein
MLNEIYDAASRLVDCDISPKDWHKEYRSVRKPKRVFFVFLDQLGGIANIERVNDPAEVTGLYTWESKGDLRQSFPYFNIPPLLRIHFDPKTDEDDKSIEKALKANELTGEQIRNFLARVENAESTKKWDTRAYNKLKSCLEKGKTLKSILGQAPEECQSIIALINRLEGTSVQEFYGRLRESFIRKLWDHPETAAKYFDGLFHSEAQEPGNAVTLLLELIDGTSRFEFPVRHERVRDWINTRLLSQNPVREGLFATPDIFGNDSTGGSTTLNRGRQ